jgi:NAD(P)-dependent dehydrogenase (short-subunit alcohol dehydrogenase family)
VVSDRNVDLSNQVALVTGGGGGIGRGIALELARFGANVAVADIEPSRAERTVELIGELGRTALAVPTDVMDTDQVREAVRLTDERFGRIDILVNNAGGVNGRPFVDQSERSWRRHIEINLVSMLAATSAVVPIMIRGGRGGSIVNVASIEATRAAPMFAVYAACKAGMINFTRSMALELAEYGIRTNVITPDWTQTPGTSGMLMGPIPDELPPRDEAHERAAAAYIPLGREGVIEECGSVAAFLCSTMASYVTGAMIPVDGGTWASSGWVRGRAGGWRLVGPDDPM